MKPALLLLSLFLLVGCQTPKTGMLPSDALPGPRTLAAGDLIKLTFPGAVEYNQTQKVRPDGKISLPLLGEITAAGKRFDSFQEDLAQRYASQLKNKEVVVTLETGANAIYVSGAVARPGKFVLERPMTVLEAVMEAGGFISGKSNPSKVVLVRIEKGHQVSRVIDLSGALKGRPSDALYLRSNDIIYVQESLL